MLEEELDDGVVAGSEHTHEPPEARGFHPHVQPGVPHVPPQVPALPPHGVDGRDIGGVEEGGTVAGGPPVLPVREPVKPVVINCPFRETSKTPDC